MSLAIDVSYSEYLRQYKGEPFTLHIHDGSTMVVLKPFHDDVRTHRVSMRDSVPQIYELSKVYNDFVVLRLINHPTVKSTYTVPVNMLIIADEYEEMK